MAAINKFVGQNNGDPNMAYGNSGATQWDFLMNEANAERSATQNNPLTNPGGLFTNGMMGAMNQLQSANQANQAVANARAMQQAQLGQQYQQSNQGNLAGLIGNEANQQNQLAMQQANNTNSRAMNADKYNFLSGMLPQIFGSMNGGSGGGFQGIQTNYGAGVSLGGQQAAPQSMGGMLNASAGSPSSGGGGSPAPAAPAPQMSNYSPQASGQVASGNTDWKPNNTMGSWTQGQYDPNAGEFEAKRQSMLGTGGTSQYGSPAKEQGQFGYRPPQQASSGNSGVDRRLAMQKMQPGYSPMASKYSAASGYTPRA